MVVRKVTFTKPKLLGLLVCLLPAQRLHTLDATTRGVLLGSDWESISNDNLKLCTYALGDMSVID